MEEDKDENCVVSTQQTILTFSYNHIIVGRKYFILATKNNNKL